MGVEAEQVTKPAELHEALARGVRAEEPYLVEVVVEQTYSEPAPASQPT